jgi:hypothetical protein
MYAKLEERKRFKPLTYDGVLQGLQVRVSLSGPTLELRGLEEAILGGTGKKIIHFFIFSYKNSLTTCSFNI